MEKLKPQSSYSKKQSQVISLEKGKIPPQAIDLEEVVLGAMMIDKRGVDEVIDILHPEVFYNSAHQKIFEAIFMLFKEGNLSPFFSAPLTIASSMDATICLYLGVPEVSFTVTIFMIQM